MANKVWKARPGLNIFDARLGKPDQPLDITEDLLAPQAARVFARDQRLETRYQTFDW